MYFNSELRKSCPDHQYFSWNTIDFTKFSDVHQKCEKLWKFLEIDDHFTSLRIFKLPDLAANISNFPGNVSMWSLSDNECITFSQFWLIATKRSARLRNSTSSSLLPNYSLSSWRKLYRRSSTSHCLFLMRGCAKNPLIFIGNRFQKLNFSIFWGWHGKIKNLKLKIIFLWIFNFETNSEQHFSCTLIRSSENLAQIIDF